MNPIRIYRLRRAWHEAQHLHSVEHELNEERSMSCIAVGHHWAVDGDGVAWLDSYWDFFDADARRKFLVEYRGPGAD